MDATDAGPHSARSHRWRKSVSSLLRVSGVGIIGLGTLNLVAAVYAGTIDLTMLVGISLWLASRPPASIRARQVLLALITISAAVVIWGSMPAVRLLGRSDVALNAPIEGIDASGLELRFEAPADGRFEIKGQPSGSLANLELIWSVKAGDRDVRSDSAKFNDYWAGRDPFTTFGTVRLQRGNEYVLELFTRPAGARIPFTAIRVEADMATSMRMRFAPIVAVLLAFVFGLVALAAHHVLSAERPVVQATEH